MRIRSLVAAFCSSFACLTGALTAQLHVDAAAYHPEVDGRRFFAGEPPAVSKADARLLLSGGRAVIEFWAEPGWSVAGNETDEPMFCVLYVAGERKVPAPPKKPADSTSPGANEGGAAEKPEAGGEGAPAESGGEAETPPTAGETAKPAGKAEHAADPAVAATIPVLWPRLAIYVGETKLSVQTGDRLYSITLTPPVQSKFKARGKVYFVVTLAEKRAVVFADGVQLGQFRMELADMKEPASGGAGSLSDLPPVPGPGWRLCVGAIGEARFGTVTTIDVSKASRVGAERDLATCVRDFDGTLGGIRIWNASIHESQFLGAKPVILQRGAAELGRSIAFKDPAGGGKEPNYGQLVLFSDFRDDAPAKPASSDLYFESPSNDGLVLQYPLSGHWVNASKKRVRPLLQPPPGLDNAYGNVDGYPIITIFPTGDPDAWVVYQDASLAGLIVRNPAKGGRWEYTDDAEGRANSGIVVTVANDRIEFDTAASGLAQRLFGGNAGDATTRIELERPSADGWTGSFVDASNGFYTAGLIRYTKTAYRAFDLTKMDWQLAFMERGTGSSRFLFAPPDPLKQTFDADAGGTIIPYGFRYEPVEQGVASHVATMASNATQWAQANSTTAGTSTEWQACDFIANLKNGKATGGAGIIQRAAEGKPLVQGENTTEQDKDAAKLLGAGQQTESSSTTTKDFSHREGEVSKKHSWLLTRAFTRDFNLTMNKSEARLDVRFVEEMERLANLSRSPADLAAECAKFVEQWGTHYALSVTYGAMMVSERTVTEQERYASETRGSSVEHEERRKYEVKIPAIGGYVPETNLFKDDNGWKKGSDNSATSGSKSGESFTQQSVRYIPTGKELVNEGQGMKYEYPVPLFYDLRPISQLLSPAYFDDPRIFHDVREALHRQIKKYLRDRSSVPPKDEEETWLQLADRKIEIWAGQAEAGQAPWKQIDRDDAQQVSWYTLQGSSREPTPLFGPPEIGLDLPGYGFALEKPALSRIRSTMGELELVPMWRDSNREPSSPTLPLLILTSKAPPLNAGERDPTVDYGDQGDLLDRTLTLSCEMPTRGYKVLLTLVLDGMVLRGGSALSAPDRQPVKGSMEFKVRELIPRVTPRSATTNQPLTFTADYTTTRTVDLILRMPEEMVPKKLPNLSGTVACCVGKGQLTVDLITRLTESYHQVPRARVSQDSLAVLRAHIKETASAAAGAFKRPMRGRRIETRTVPTDIEASENPTLEPGESSVSADGAFSCAWKPDATASLGYVVARRNQDTRITDWLPTDVPTLEDMPGGGTYTYSIYKQVRGLVAGQEMPLATFETRVPGEAKVRTDVPPMNGPDGAGQAPQSVRVGRSLDGTIACEAAADGTATLRWQPVDLATGYRVLRRSRSARVGLAALDQDVESHSIVVRPPEGVWLYVVSAIVDGKPGPVVGSQMVACNARMPRPERQTADAERPQRNSAGPQEVIDVTSGKVELQWPEVPGAEKYVVRRIQRRITVDLEATTNSLTVEPGAGVHSYMVFPVVVGVVAEHPCKTFRIRVRG